MSAGRDREELAPGEHACFLYRNDQEMIAVARKLWGQCRKEGWKLLYIARVNPREFVERMFRDEGSPPGALDQGIRIITSDDSEFQLAFSTVSVALKFISQEIREAREHGFSALLILRETPPIPSDTHSSQRLVSDMAGIEALLAEKTLLLVCEYHVEKFPATVLQDVLRTHPVAIIGTEVVDNLFYIPSSDARRFHLPSIEVQHWVKTLLDLKSAKQALAESEKRFHDLLENANDLIQSVDPEGKFLFVNRAWRETLGYSPEEVESINLFDIIDPSCSEKCMVVFHEVMDGKRPGRVEAIFRSKSGKKVYVEGNVNCRFSEGKALYTRGVFRDITDIRRAETKSQQMDHAMDVLLDMAPHITFILDSKGVILHTNRAARELVSGGDIDLMRKIPIWDLFTDKNAFRENLGAFRKRDDPTARWRFRDLEGKEWNVEMCRHRIPNKKSELFVAVLEKPG